MSATENLAVAHRVAAEQAKYHATLILETLTRYGHLPTEGLAKEAFAHRCQAYARAAYDRDDTAAKLAELETAEPAGRTP